MFFLQLGPRGIDEREIATRSNEAQTLVLESLFVKGDSSCQANPTFQIIGLDICKCQYKENNPAKLETSEVLSIPELDQFIRGFAPALIPIVDCGIGLPINRPLGRIPR